MNGKQVKEAIGEAAMLEMLAEEATELAHAALKLARKIRNQNPTPVDYEELYSHLDEESADVRLCMTYLHDIECIRIRNVINIFSKKDKRFEERLEESRGK